MGRVSHSNLELQEGSKNWNVDQQNQGGLTTYIKSCEIMWLDGNAVYKHRQDYLYSLNAKFINSVRAYTTDIR